MSSVTRSLTVASNLRIGLQLVGSVGQVINARLVVEGIQFEKASSRSIGRYALLPPSSAWLLLAQPGARLGYVDGEYTAQHSVTSGIPLDSTAPLWTEGAHLISVNYVPKKIGSKLLITATLPIVGMNSNAAALAVIYANEVSQRTGVITPTGATYDCGITVRHVLTVTDLNSIKLSLRFGPQTGGFIAYINIGSSASVNSLGGKVSTLLTVEEIAQ
jgi:hypothetical protein